MAYEDVHTREEFELGAALGQQPSDGLILASHLVRSEAWCYYCDATRLFWQYNHFILDSSSRWPTAALGVLRTLRCGLQNKHSVFPILLPTAAPLTHIRHGDQVLHAEHGR
jgi:hypothetical protein